MKLRTRLLSWIALGSLGLSACSSTAEDDTANPTPSSSSTLRSVTSSAEEVTPAVLDSTVEIAPIEAISSDPAPVSPTEPQATTASSAASSTWFPEPDSPFGVECFSGAPELWPTNVDTDTGCRPILDEQALAESLDFTIEVEMTTEPYAVECLSGTPGPTLMSDGSVQHTEDCYQQGISAPGYVNEGELANSYWHCMNSGGETEACREQAHSF